jgi:o-succinylbenzoate synthase
MRIAASPYGLVARADGRRRTGALLRVDFSDGPRGYADLHPWPEFGDPPLADLLAALREEATERDPLLSASLALARADAEARAAGRSLFDGLTVPPSHASLPFGLAPGALERAREEGFARVKLKGWGFSPEERRAFAESGLLFRLDFNARLDFEAVCRILDAWGDLGWIDWLEDPCPYDDDRWRSLRERYGARLALDLARRGDEREYDVLVLKPARGVGPLPERPVAITSYLDHPVGQLGAAWVAARLGPTEIGGLVTHPVYEESAFSRRLGVERGRLIPPDGPGIGFDREFERLDWRDL